MSLRNALVHYWRLDEASDGSAPVPRADVIGGNTLADVALTPSAAGRLGNAANFTATLFQRLVAASGYAPDIKDFTLACWIKPMSWDNFRMIFSTSNSPATLGGIWLALNASGWLYFVLSDGTNQVTGYPYRTPVPLGQWSHLVAAFDRDGQTGIWVNGIAGTVSYSLASVGSIDASDGTAVGARWPGGNPFDGQIDEFGIWERLLTPPERSQLYNGGAGWDPTAFSPAWAAEVNRSIGLGVGV